MKIATWNVKRPRMDQRKKLAALQSRMQSIDVDIWILTETHLDACAAATRPWEIQQGLGGEGSCHLERAARYHLECGLETRERPESGD